MGRFGAAVSLLAGICFLVLGLLFLLGAAGQARRIFIGLVFLGLGAIFVGLGVRSFRRLAMIVPEKLREEILELARKRNGETAWNEIVALLGWRTSYARPVMDGLMRDGSCRRSTKGGELFYIFPELQARLMVLFCEYCKAEYPISAETTSCPNCGGPLVTRVAVRSLSEGEFFSMDGA